MTICGVNVCADGSWAGGSKASSPAGLILSLRLDVRAGAVVRDLDLGEACKGGGENCEADMLALATDEANTLL